MNIFHSNRQNKTILFSRLSRRVSRIYDYYYVQPLQKKTLSLIRSGPEKIITELQKHDHRQPGSFVDKWKERVPMKSSQNLLRNIQENSLLGARY